MFFSALTIGNQVLRLISLTNHLWSDFYIKFGPLYNLVSSLHIDCKLVSDKCIPLSLKNIRFNLQETKFYYQNLRKLSNLTLLNVICPHFVEKMKLTDAKTLPLSHIWVWHLKINWAFWIKKIWSIFAVIYNFASKW